MRRGRARRQVNERGFTLLELLMTLGVTTIGLVGLLSLHLSIARGNDGASRAAEATQIGHALLEELRAVKAPQMMELLTGSALSTPPTDVTMPTVIGRGNMTYRRRVLVQEMTAASTSLWRVRIEVGWTDDGAALNAAGGLLDHLIAVEVIRTFEEAL